MNSEIKKVTPELAKELLTGNTMNRPKNEKYITELSIEMRNGKWLNTGEPIIVSKEGRLLDGQHRLEAILKSGCSFDMFIVRGVEKDAFKVIDTGKNRTSADVLHTAGFENARYVASIARMIISYNNGYYSLLSSNSGAGTYIKKRSNTTNSDILDFSKENTEQIAEALRFAWKISKNGRFLTDTEYAFFYYIFSRKNIIDSEKFLTLLSSGASLEEGNVILKLRNALVNSKMSGRPFLPRTRIGMIFKAWNFFRRGKSKGNIIFTPNEEIPVLL